MKRFAWLLLALACAAPPAGAADKVYAYEVETAEPARLAAAAAGGVHWSCSGTRCTASARGGRVSVKGCSELARQVGPIASYRSEVNRLGARDLDACNRLGLGAGAVAKSGAAPGQPQRATTGELTYTGQWPPARAAAERKP